MLPVVDTLPQNISRIVSEINVSIVGLRDSLFLPPQIFHLARFHFRPVSSIVERIEAGPEPSTDTQTASSRLHTSCVGGTDSYGRDGEQMLGLLRAIRSNLAQVP